MKATAIAIIIASFLFVDYATWIRGGESKFFEDKTQIEKDLREIQKLEIAKKLKELKQFKKGE